MYSSLNSGPPIERVQWGQLHPSILQAYHFQKHCNCTAETHLFGQKYAVQILARFLSYDCSAQLAFDFKMRENLNCFISDQTGEFLLGGNCRFESEMAVF